MPEEQQAKAAPSSNCDGFESIISYLLARAVVEKDCDLLSADDYQKHSKAVAAAIGEELMVWIKHNCFRRRLRRTARNILDIRFVGEWKRVKFTDGNSTVRIIRCR